MTDIRITGADLREEVVRVTQREDLDDEHEDLPGAVTVDVPCPQNRDCDQIPGDVADVADVPAESVRALTDRLDAQSAQLDYLVSAVSWLTDTVSALLNGISTSNPMAGMLIKNALKK
jgi:NAD(P)-dependent dehydrogenase (short-subunit alcohol dehydrogenase family)